MTIKPHLVHYAVFAALAITLAGCSSTPKLKAPPPARSGSLGGGQAPGSAVQSVQAGNANGDDLSGPPVSVGRVVYFDFDSFVVKPEYQDLISQQARYLQSHRASHVTLEGNTDERGSSEYNLALGQKRAEAVQRALALEGASNGQIESVSFGAEKPADPGHDEEAYSKNRRVEFRYHH
ncbi:MAG: peptidoglycan-associated lipoprotein Pal [Burkholderiaceae bacterium]|nr:peptidoglycan-associated lipoprotein Pal [Burkholderiaceae bacterium]